MQIKTDYYEFAVALVMLHGVHYEVIINQLCVTDSSETFSEQSPWATFDFALLPTKISTSCKENKKYINKVVISFFIKIITG